MKVQSEAISLNVPSTSSFRTMVLHGTLTHSSDPPPVAAVIVHPGSGPTDRNGNAPGLQTDCLKQLAESLARHNIAVLQIDKRGVGESTSPDCTEDRLTIETYVGDLLLWHTELTTRFNKPVCLIGHSEGALISLIAASQCPDVHALVLLCATSYPLHELVIQQLRRNAPEQVPVAKCIIEQLLRNKTDVDCPPELASFFRPSAQPYWASVMCYRPLSLMSEVKIPMMIVSGTEDIQVPCEDTARLTNGSGHASYVRIDRMSHTLKTAGPGISVSDHYRNPSLPVSPELVDHIRRFVSQQQR